VDAVSPTLLAVIAACALVGSVIVVLVAGALIAGGHADTAAGRDDVREGQA
jgi:hypothetical protein